MGKYQPKRRKAMHVYQPLLKSWVGMMQRPPQRKEPLSEAHPVEELSTDELSTDGLSTNEPPTNGQSIRINSGSKVSQLTHKLWHMSDDFQWMSPLPLMHRRWIIISVLVIFIILLWPYSPKNTYAPSDKPIAIPMQAELYTGQEHSSLVTSNQAPQNQINSQPMQTTLSPQSQDNTHWQRYRIQTGQTLAQLFRANNLAVNDVFAMAQVEGRDKPLSNLQAGQEVKIQRNLQGIVTTLEITNEQNNVIRFIRQPDGSYQRSR